MSSTAPRTARRLRAVLVVISGGLGAALPLGLAVPAQAVGDPGLVTKVNSVLRDARTTKAKSGVVVLDAASGERLYQRYGTRAVLPASNTKIVTAVTAMHVLGPTYTFKTEVIRRAPIVDRTLTGRLYLKGYGDPTSRPSDYAALAREVKAAGIDKITGALVVDATFFDRQTYNPGWSTSYASAYYAAPISALTLAPNADLDSGTIMVSYAPGRAGRRAKITTTPAAAITAVKIDNRTTTSSRGSASTFSARRAHGSNTITVTGRVPAGRSARAWQITVAKPELVAAAVFRAELANAKVKISGGTVVAATPASYRKVIDTDRSIPLARLLVPFLKLSNNMHAEALTKTMGAANGQPGSWRSGLAHTRAYLVDLGTPMAGVTLTDGSGLTRRNKLTPLALATVLQKVQSEDWFDDFRKALPVAGNPNRMVGGTLRSRMTDTAAADNAVAKTGTLTGVTALSGYVDGADGRRYVFSMISNYTGSTPRPVENTLVVALARWRRSA